MKKRMVAVAIILTILVSACSSSQAPQNDTASEKTTVVQEDGTEGNTTEPVRSDTSIDTQDITYHTISLQIPARWKYVENDDDTVMIYRSEDSFFLCVVDAYNISEDVDENTTMKDIYPLCKQLIQNQGGNDSFEYENGSFKGCPGVYFTGPVVNDDGEATVVSGIVFAADINMYMFYYMTDIIENHPEEIKVADQIMNSITISPSVNTGVYGISQEENMPIIETESDETKETNTIQTAESSRDMGVGEIGKKDDIYAGLSYVKKMNYVPTAFYDYDEIGDGNEVILAFFDFYNDSESRVTVRPEDITCYADGSQVLDAQENHMSVYCDGIRQLNSVDMDGKTQMMSVHDFIVPSGWNELKFFYESECVWTVSAEDVRTEDFKFESMYPVEIEREPTEEGAVIYKGDYEIVFKGVTDYIEDNSGLGEESHVIFKFTINNTSENPLDYSLAGYEMRGYQNNYSLGDSSFALDEQIDGFSNIYSIDKIEAGMSANIYIAFDAFVEDGDLYMVFDDGYIQNSVRGTVFVDR